MPLTTKPGLLRDGLRSTRGVWIALLVLVAVVHLGISRRARENPRSRWPAPAIDNRGPRAPADRGDRGWLLLGVAGRVSSHTKGIKQALSGYSGGEKSTADYEKVGTGRTGHAEVGARFVFDPKEISYGDILRIYFSVAHEPGPSSIARGPDVGTQYRSAIFYSRRVAAAHRAGLHLAAGQGACFSRARSWTRVGSAEGFYPAEAYHQDFLAHNPTYPYIVINDLPKIANLKRLFPDRYREKPS